jgi:hypothetical protein
MLITVTNETEIRECQRRLSEILETKLTKKKECLFGTPGGSGRLDVNHNDKIWWYYTIC